GVHAQVDDRGDSRRRRARAGERNEGRSVEADEPLLRAQPEIAVGGLGDRVDEASRKSPFAAPALADVLGQRAIGIERAGRRGREGRPEREADETRGPTPPAAPRAHTNISPTTPAAPGKG